MKWFWTRAPRKDRLARAAVKRLSRKLAKENDRQIGTLSRFADDPGQLETLFGPLKFTAEAQAEIGQLLRKPHAGQAGRTAGLLSELARAVTERLRAEPWENFHAWRALSRTLGLLLTAQEALLPAMPLVPAPLTTGKKRRVVVTEDLLQECYRSLFPAERMLVVAGRRMGDTIRLTDIFDVTGDQSGGHVRADPALLGRALIAMDQSDAFLAAWLHSHPGLGPAATHPSPTDLKQDQDWLRDYPNLLNIIVVKDRWVRFWGTGLEIGQIEVEFLGRGLIKENQHGYVCRLDENRRLPPEPTDADAGHRDADGAPIASEA